MGTMPLMFHQRNPRINKQHVSFRRRSPADVNALRANLRPALAATPITFLPSTARILPYGRALESNADWMSTLMNVFQALDLVRPDYEPQHAAAIHTVFTEIVSEIERIQAHFKLVEPHRLRDLKRYAACNIVCHALAEMSPALWLADGFLQHAGPSFYGPHEHRHAVLVDMQVGLLIDPTADQFVLCCTHMDGDILAQVGSIQLLEPEAHALERTTEGVGLFTYHQEALLKLEEELNGKSVS